MQSAQLLLLILVAIAAFGAIARKLRVPDPIVLVLGGLALSLVPRLPRVELDPSWVFLLFLPPLLHASAWFIAWDEFRAALRPILLLAIGLVVFSTVIVAYATHWALPQMPLSVCFVLGAIVSPPDAVAASAIAQQLRLPRRMVTILEGESLVNDATGLVAYKFAVDAVVNGHFSLAQASGHFVVVALGGIAVGLAIGLLAVQLFKRTRDDSIVIVLSLVAPYTSYLVAESLEVSSVLAAVTGGAVMGLRASEVLTANARLLGFGFWNTFIFLLNGAVFMLIGLELNVVRAGVTESMAELLRAAAIVCGAAIVARLVWVFPGAYLPRLIDPSIRRREPRPKWTHVLVVGWSGMRGVVSLAAALALPIAFPHRGAILFLSFSVILVTLVLQGLTLPLLIRWLKVGGGTHDHEEEERDARLAAANAALARVRIAATAREFEGSAIELVAGFYEERVRGLSRGESSLVGEPKLRNRVAVNRALRLVALGAERATLLRRHRERRLARELLVKLERELDHEESRVAGEASPR